MGANGEQLVNGFRVGDEEEIEQDEGLEDNNEAHEIADRCISDILESV